MLEKAKLVEIERFSDTPQPERQSGGKQVIVQFNPESLRVSLSNQNSGGNQPGGGSSRQFVGSGTSSLTVELLFDMTTDEGRENEQPGVDDVRRKTADVAYFVMATPQRNGDNRRVPPRVRFQWGAFVFEGVVDSLDETLDYFSAEGVPLRATVSLKLSRDDIAFVFGQPAPASTGTPGTAPLDQARPGESLQQMAGRGGQSENWKDIAAANNIDDPLRLAPGALIDTNVSARVGVGGSMGAGLSATAAASMGGGASVGFSAGLGGGIGLSAGAGASLGAGGGISTGAGVGIGGGVGASTGAGAAIGGGASASIGAGAAIGGGASASGGAVAGFGAGVDVVGG